MYENCLFLLRHFQNYILNDLWGILSWNLTYTFWRHLRLILHIVTFRIVSTLFILKVFLVSLCLVCPLYLQLKKNVQSLHLASHAAHHVNHCHRLEEKNRALKVELAVLRQQKLQHRSLVSQFVVCLCCLFVQFLAIVTLLDFSMLT